MAADPALFRHMLGPVATASPLAEPADPVRRPAPAEALRRCCRAPGCGAPLENKYTMRSRLCVAHMRAESLVFGGQTLRFCQKCNRLHELHMFTGNKRTCQARLDQHNAARRKEVSPPAAGETSAAASPEKRVRHRRSPPAAQAPRSDSDAQAAASTHSGAGAAESALEDDALAVFNTSVFASDAFDLEELLALDRDDMGGAAPPPAAMLQALPLPPPSVRTLATELEASLRAYSVHVKLPHADGSRPDALPAELSGSLSRLLSALGVPPVALAECVRPGCVLLTLDALTPAGEHDVAALRADTLLAALAAEGGALGAFIRGQASVTVRVGDAEAAASPPTAPATRSRVAAAPRTPPLAQLALLSTSESVLTALPHAAPLLGPLACRLAGDVLPCHLRADGSGLVLPACGLEGTLLVEHLPEGTPLHRAGVARPVLLTRDAAVASEIATALGAFERDAAERALLICGAALRPDAPVAVLAPAAALVARLDLPATVTRISVALRVRCVADGATFEPLFLQLLSAAVAARAHAAHRALLAAHVDAAAGAALASSLLRAARRDGHALLPCALLEASRALAHATTEPSPHVLRGASAVLAAMAASAASEDAAYDSSDEAEGAAADAALAALQSGGSGSRHAQAAATAFTAAQDADEAGFIGYVCDVNLNPWRTTALLSLFVRTVHAWLYWTYMRSEPGPEALLRARGAVLRKQVHSLRFYDPADLSAPSMTVLDYPWATVLAAAPPYMAWTVLVLVPTHLAFLVFSTSSRLRPFVRRRYEPLFACLLVLELLTYIFMDAFILHVTGRVPRYAFADCAMHALGTLFFHSTGMFGLRLSLVAVLMRSFVSCVGICVWTRAWGMLLWPENVVQLASLAVSFVLAPRRERRMRAQHAAVAAAAAAAEPAAKAKTA